MFSNMDLFTNTDAILDRDVLWCMKRLDSTDLHVTELQFSGTKFL